MAKICQKFKSGAGNREESGASPGISEHLRSFTNYPRFLRMIWEGMQSGRNWLVELVSEPLHAPRRIFRIYKYN